MDACKKQINTVCACGQPENLESLQSQLSTLHQAGLSRNRRSIQV